MKFNIVVVSLLSTLVSAMAGAATVESAKIENGSLIIGVSYGGGCIPHVFDIELLSCAESSPVQCQANLIHKMPQGFDPCESMRFEEVVIPLASKGLNSSYYSNGSLRIKGADGSSASVTLPDSRLSTQRPPSKKADVECVTHTQSQLLISYTGKSVKLTAKSGEVAEYKITRSRTRVIETLPSIWETTITLDDGRGLELSFEGNGKIGTGQFLRLDGSRSPEFTCAR